jgi:RNA polymerase sigma-70 factor (ECF subfamily)
MMLIDTNNIAEKSESWLTSARHQVSNDLNETGRDIARSTDGQLVRQTLAGNRRSFDDLIRRYQRQAVAVAYRLLGNTHDALEVTQEAFLKAFTSLATLQKPEAFGGWFMRIVANLSLNCRRGRKSRAQLPLDEIAPAAAMTANPGHQVQSSEMGARLRQALAELPERQRLALTMFTIDEMPQKQIAETLGCSVEAVKWHVFQGRRKMRELMKDVL